MTGKFIPARELALEDTQVRLANAVLCFGHFNTIHPGHIRYFKNARRHSGPLVVAIESDVQIPKSDHADIFSEEERASSVAALDMIDFVIVLNSMSLRDLVLAIKPATFLLGNEFKKSRPATIDDAVKAVQGTQGSVVFDPGETYYSNVQLFQSSVYEVETARWRDFQGAQQSQRVDFERCMQKMDQAGKPRILVIGDTIVDRYVVCDPIGMSNEAPVVVVRELETRDFVGGAGIVAAHVSALGARCSYLSVVGNDESGEWFADRMKAYDVETVLIEDIERPTTFKTRYMVDNQKLFRVSKLKEHSISEGLEEQVIKTLEDIAPTLEAVLVSDFVYGVITARILKVLRQLSKKHGFYVFGDLQCSSQIGDIKKFQHFDLICPTEREARIALGNQDDGLEFVANALMEATEAENMILKLGSEGFIAYAGRSRGSIPHRQHFPALCGNPLDVTGAGDSLLATMAVGLTAGLSVMGASTIATCVAAVSVQNIGNQPVGLDQVRRFYIAKDKESEKS